MYEGRVARERADVEKDAAKAERETASENGEKKAERAPTFDELITGRYKRDFDRRVQQILKGRLRDAKGAQARLDQFAPALQIVAERYGLDFSDLQKADPTALVKALEGDQKLYEDAAKQEGVPVDQFIEKKRAQRAEKTAQAARMRQYNEMRMRNQYAQLQRQGAEFRKEVPAFSLAKEMQNGTFARMVATGFPLKTAYYAVHYPELEAQRRSENGQQMRAVAKSAQEQAIAALRANARRPAESGTTPAPATVRKIDIKGLKGNDIKELLSRARRGETLTSDLFT